MKLPTPFFVVSVATFAAAALVASSASAQQAVQWRVEDGGNGHWYRYDAETQSRTTAQARVDAVGAHLVTITHPSEYSFLRASFPEIGSVMFWMGGIQAPGSCEPGCGWQWLSGEIWSYANWAPGEPNNVGSEPWLGCLADGKWNDFHSGWHIKSMLEWSADCNGDGIVDYGQCRDGSLPDYNSNNVPDCCERGEACIVDNYPVQWRAEDGGNGHWYKRVNNEAEVTWTFSRDAALAAGGHLVTLVSAAEQAWAKATLVDGHPVCQIASWAYPRSAWIGLFQDVTSPSYSEPAGGWCWVTGEPVEYTNWSPSEPNNVDYPAHFAGMYFDGTWDDTPVDTGIYCHTAFIVEWSADCNGDGIVDYGQILQGQLVDSDQNGVPDVCEIDPCPGDITNGGTVDAIDLSILLFAWGTSGQGEFDSDADNNGLVDGGDLALVLIGWGPCPQ